MDGTFNQLEYDLRSNCTNFPDGFLDFLWQLMHDEELENKFSKPMVWIGIYIAIASLFCILPIVADLLHGLKNKKLWFPCKYFTLNAASLTVIAVAMKLPMDLNNPMPNNIDQAAKLGSLVFMCTMMANLLPSLATMESKELLANIIALGVLVITLVVNVCIQIQTGVISYYEATYYGFGSYLEWFISYTYVAILLALLMIHTCSALMIPKSKHILESKYKAAHETALKELELQKPGRVTIEKLTQHVSNHWIMAKTGNPQFMTVCFATTYASGVLCVTSTVIHVITMIYIITVIRFFASDYKWTVMVILITQTTGIVLGTIAPISRCFASISFKISIKWICNHIRIFKVESYCTQKLSEWKHSSVPFKVSSRRCKILIHDLKILNVSFLIGFQKTVVVACKMIALAPIFLIIGGLCCFHCWKWLTVMFGSSNVTVQNQYNKDLTQYVLQLEDDMVLAERTLTSISNSLNCLIQKAEKKQPNNLMKLLEESSGFEGVGKYDVNEVVALHKEKYVDCWSLPVVTLTTIAISLPNIQKDMVDKLLRGVSEGLTYVTLVEETLNATDEYVIIQNAARRLWLEVEVYHKWLGNKLQNPSHQVNPASEIVEWLNDKATHMVIELEGKDTEGSNDDSLYMSISANSMYRISQTILISHHANIDQASQEELFVQLSSMISNILAACLTNLPQVIAMKCHTSIIEKREASVYTAAQLLGETTQIINSLQDRELPNLNPSDLPFIDKWHDWFLHPLP